MTLEQSYKAKIVDLEQKLSETSDELSLYNKELLKAQEDDISMVYILFTTLIISLYTEITVLNIAVNTACFSTLGESIENVN